MIELLVLSVVAGNAVAGYLSYSFLFHWHRPDAV